MIMEASRAGILDDSDIKTLAKEVLLPKKDVKQLWVTHLMIISGNCKRGTQKAAETRRSKEEIQRSLNINLTFTTVV